MTGALSKSRRVPRVRGMAQGTFYTKRNIPYNKEIDTHLFPHIPSGRVNNRGIKPWSDSD
jgi:hypothetical protein